MLEKKDLEAIAELIDARMAKTDSRLDQMDSRLDQMDSRFEQIDSRFEQIDNRFEQIDSQFAQVNDRFGQLEKTMTVKIEHAIEESENFLLDEMERYDKKNERQFDKINQRLDVLEQICRGTRNDSAMIDILFKTSEKHECRIQRLEHMMA